MVRFFQWIFSKLESSITDEVKIPLLLSLGKVNLKFLASIDSIRFYSLNLLKCVAHMYTMQEIRHIGDKGDNVI